MSYKKFAAIIALFALLLPACQRSLDTGQPVAPTSIYAGDSISTQGDPMAQIAQTATAMMQTPTADGAPSATPESENGTPDAEATATPGVGLPIASAAPSSTPETDDAFAGQATATPTQIVVSGRPSTYTLQTGEFPWCIARRFNVDPQTLLSLSGLREGVVYPAGTLLRIPQSGSFPGPRALRVPVSAGVESFVGKIGTAVSWGEAGGQVQLQSELWTADAADGSARIRKGDRVEVVEVKGLRLKVRKIKG